MTAEQIAAFATTLISDGLDALGLPAAVLPPAVRAIVPPRGGRMAGPVKTYLYRVRTPEEGVQPPAKAQMLAQLQRMEEYLQPGDVLVIGFEGAPPAVGIVGDLFGTLYAKRGAVGIVTPGLVRDAQELAALGLGVYAAGTTPLNSLGRVAMSALGAPVTVGGVGVANGDWLVADADGVVIVPAAQLGQPALLEWLQEAAEREKGTLDAVRSSGKLSDAFRTHGRL